MSRRPTALVLSHLLSSGILKADESEVILTALPSDSAVTVTVAVVGSFRSDGSLPALDSVAKFEWFLQCVGFALTLPIFFHESLFGAVAICNYWLTQDIFQLSKEDRNTYAQRILRYLSNAFDYRRDNGQSANRAKLITKLIENLDQMQTECSGWMDETTFDTLVRITIGSTDFLLQAWHEHKLPESPRQPILTGMFALLFNTLCTSQLSGKETWALFSHHSKEWTNLPPFITAWRQNLLRIFRLVCEGKSGDGTGYQLVQCCHLIDFDQLLRTNPSHADFGHLIDSLFDTCRKAHQKADSLYFPLYPVEICFQLFGRWMFNLFGGEIDAGHALILRALFAVVDTASLPTGSPWIPVVMKLVDFGLNSAIPSVQNAVLTTGVHILTRFFCGQLCERFFALVEKADLAVLASPDAWMRYSTLLGVLSNYKPLPTAVMAKAIAASMNLNASANILVTAMEQSPDAFCELSAQLYDQNLPCLDVVNSILASYMPFVTFNRFNALLAKLLESVRNNPSNIPITHTFLAVVMQFHRFHNDLYKVMAEVLDVVHNIYDCFGIEQHHLRAVVSQLSGRPIDAAPSSPIEFAFMVGDRSLVTVLENDDVVVRDSRGIFVWRLDEVTPAALSFDPLEIGELPPLRAIDSQPSITEYHSRFTELDVVLGQLSEIEPIDQSFQEPIKHRDKMHMKALRHHAEARSTILNFVISTGLDIRKLEEPVAGVIAKFDAIPPVKVAEVGLVHMSEAGFAKEATPHFEWLREVLGGQRNLGLIAVKFVEQQPSVTPVAVIFNETPFAINIKHELAPKGRLAIFIQPFDQQRVLINVQKIDPKLKFWNNLEQKRLVDVGILLATVCAILFRYFLAAAEDDLFEKDAERFACLQAVKTSAIPECDLLQKDILLPG
jgi:hypothetical protein